jgi:hypothetical protein
MTGGCTTSSSSTCEHTVLHLSFLFEPGVIVLAAALHKALFHVSKVLFNYS